MYISYIYICIFVYIYIRTYIYTYIYVYSASPFGTLRHFATSYGVATISRLLKIIGLSCERAL